MQSDREKHWELENKWGPCLLESESVLPAQTRPLPTPYLPTSPHFIFAEGESAAGRLSRARLYLYFCDYLGCRLIARGTESEGAGRR